MKLYTKALKIQQPFILILTNTYLPQTTHFSNQNYI